MVYWQLRQLSSPLYALGRTCRILEQQPDSNCTEPETVPQRGDVPTGENLA